MRKLMNKIIMFFLSFKYVNYVYLDHTFRDYERMIEDLAFNKIGKYCDDNLFSSVFKPKSISIRRLSITKLADDFKDNIIYKKLLDSKLNEHHMSTFEFSIHDYAFWNIYDKIVYGISEVYFKGIDGNVWHYIIETSVVFSILDRNYDESVKECICKVMKALHSIIMECRDASVLSKYDFPIDMFNKEYTYPKIGWTQTTDFMIDSDYSLPMQTELLNKIVTIDDFKRIELSDIK